MPRIPPPIMSLVKIQIEHLIKDGEKDLAIKLAISAMLIEKFPEIIGIVTKNTITGNKKSSGQPKTDAAPNSDKSLKEMINDALISGSNYAKVKIIEGTICNLALISDYLNSASYNLVKKGFNQIKVEASKKLPRLPGDTTDYNEYWFSPEYKTWTDNATNITYPINDEKDVMFFKKKLKVMSSNISSMMKTIDSKREADALALNLGSLAESLKLNTTTKKNIETIKIVISDLENEIIPLHSRMRKYIYRANFANFKKAILLSDMDNKTLEKKIDSDLSVYAKHEFINTEQTVLKDWLKNELDYRTKALTLETAYSEYIDLLNLRVMQNLNYEELDFRDRIATKKIDIKYDGYSESRFEDSHTTIPSHIIYDHHISVYLKTIGKNEETINFEASIKKLKDGNVIKGGLILSGNTSTILRRYQYTPDESTTESENTVKTISKMDIKDVSENFTVKDISGTILYEQNVTSINGEVINDIKDRTNNPVLSPDEVKQLILVLRSVILSSAVITESDRHYGLRLLTNYLEGRNIWNWENYVGPDRIHTATNSRIVKIEIDRGSQVNSPDVFDSNSLIDENTFKYIGPLGDTKKVNLYCYALLGLFNPLDILLQIWKAISRLTIKIRIFIAEAYKAVSLLIRAKKTGIQVGKDSTDYVSGTFQTVASVGVGSSVSIVTI